MTKAAAVVGALLIAMTIVPSHAQAPVTPYQSSTEKAGAEQKKAAADWEAKNKKETDCRRQAKAQKFKLNMVARNRFIKKCVAS